MFMFSMNPFEVAGAISSEGGEEDSEDGGLKNMTDNNFEAPSIENRAEGGLLAIEKIKNGEANLSKGEKRDAFELMTKIAEENKDKI